MVLGLSHIRGCARTVIDNVVQDNPVTNVISTVASIFKPSKPSKPKPDEIVILQDGTKAIIKSKFRTDVHLDIGLYNSLIPTDKIYLLPKPGVGVTLFSYGQSSKVNTFRFIRLGVGGWMDNGVDITVAPVMYNLGHKLPIITNTYVYPHIGYNINHNKIIAGVGLSLSF